MLLEDEQHVVKWLSQYGALPKTQLIRMLRKPKSTAEKILRNLKKQMRISDVGGGYYLGLDSMCQPDQRTILAVWVLLKFIDQVDPMAHYPAVYPSQLFFLKENTGYEIVVLYEGEGNLPRLLQPENDLKYIIVLPHISMVSQLRLPNVPCLFATVDFCGDEEPEVTFYSEEVTALKKTPFQTVLTRIDVRVRLLHKKCEEIRVLYNGGDMIGAYEEALKLEEVSEHLTLFARALPAYTGNHNADNAVKKMLREIIPVEIGYTKEGWFSVRMPMLLPKKAHGSADYVRSFLYPAMQDFFADKPTVRYRDCVLIYRHVYDQNRPERKMRDHDNIEINMVSDIVALYVMPDDGPEVCSHYYCSAAGTEERTEIYVVPKNEFGDWLKGENSMSDEGVKLYENTKKSPENLMSKEAKTAP